MLVAIGCWTPPRLPRRLGRPHRLASPGFRLYWRWRSRSAPIGCPRIDAQLRMLIRRMVHENPSRGRRRIQAELHLQGYDVSELTVAKYMRPPRPSPSRTWRAFLDAHLREIVAIDFFVVLTLTFRLLETPGAVQQPRESSASRAETRAQAAMIYRTPYRNTQFRID
jgi:hypothetical protein